MEHRAAGRRRLIAWAVLLLALGVGVVWFLGRADRDALEEPARVREAATGVEDAPRLDGLARSANGGAVTPPANSSGSPAPAPSKGPAVGGGSMPPYEDKLPRVRVRLELEGTGEALAVTRVMWGGAAYDPRVAPDGRVPVEPDGWVHTTTDDPRAAIPTASKLLPKDVPAEIVIKVARANDPRLAHLTLRAVDAVTRAPLARAYLDVGPRGCGQVARIPADAEGRIRVDRTLLAACRTAGGTLPGLAQAVYAPDHEPPSVVESVPTIPEDVLVAWLDRGEIEVPLKPLEAGLGRPARIRLRGPDDEPIRGASVTGLYPSLVSPRMALRADEEGLVLWERAPEFFGLVYFADGVPAAFVVLVRHDAPVEVRFPRRVRVELVVSGGPPAEQLQPRWELEPEFRDGLDTVDPKQPTSYELNGSPRARGRLITDHAYLPGLRGRGLGGEPPRFECLLPQGVRTRVLLGDRRYLDVEPQRDGEVIEVAWESLAER